MASDFQYLYRLREEFEKQVDFWFVNLTGVDDEEKENAKAFAELHKLDAGSILMDVDEEAATTMQLSKFCTIVLVSRDNYVFRKLEQDFDEGAVRAAITAMLDKPLHRDYF